MKILAFDTAANACSAALLEDDRILSSRLREMKHGQAEALFGLVQEVLDEAAVPFMGVDRVATTLGPGSFTGLRVGLATARGIALAGDLPVVGVTTFEAVANGVTLSEREGCQLLVALDTKRNDLYVQGFDAALRPFMQAEVLAPSACSDFGRDGSLLVVGDGAYLLRNVFDSQEVRWSKAPGHPQATVIARLAATREPTIRLCPIYLRAPQAKLPDV